MNRQFLQNQVKHYVYVLKEGTASSYYSQSPSILPQRLSISDFDMSKVQNKGRVLAEGKCGQLMGNFTSKEDSPLKKNKPYTCRTEVFRCIDYPLLWGYGTIGISDEQGKVTKQSDTGDLVVLVAYDNFKTIHIYFFFGMGAIQYKEEVLSFVHDLVKPK